MQRPILETNGVGCRVNQSSEGSVCAIRGQETAVFPKFPLFQHLGG